MGLCLDMNLKWPKNKYKKLIIEKMYAGKSVHIRSYIEI